MPKRRFVWDTVDDCVLQETDGIGATLVTYTHEPEAYGPLVSQERSNQTNYYHFDALGSTRILTDDSQAVTDTFATDAWGSEVSRTGTTETIYRWCGKSGYQYNTACATFYVRARGYQAAIARWMSPDPIGFYDSFNAYVLTLNSPSLYIDASGLMTVTDANTGSETRVIKGRCPSISGALDGSKTGRTSKFDKDAGDIRLLIAKYGPTVTRVATFVQRVSISYQVSIGSIQPPLNCDTCPKPPPPCNKSIYKFDFVFDESLVSGDAHAIAAPEFLVARLEKVCNITQDPCCAKFWYLRVTKQVTLDRGSGVKEVSRAGSYSCPGTFPDFIDDVDPGIPEPPSFTNVKGTTPGNVVYPPVPAVTPWTSVLTAKMTYSTCADDSTVTIAWDGYKRSK